MLLLLSQQPKMTLLPPLSVTRTLLATSPVLRGSLRAGDWRLKFLLAIRRFLFVGALLQVMRVGSSLRNQFLVLKGATQDMPRTKISDLLLGTSYSLPIVATSRLTRFAGNRPNSVIGIVFKRREKRQFQDKSEFLDRLVTVPNV